MKAETSLKAGDPVKMGDVPMTATEVNRLNELARRRHKKAEVAEALLAQLWEMGVTCDCCKYKVGETTADSGCSTALHVLFCAHWDEEVV